MYSLVSYIYTHTTLSGEIFYVGKGTGKRAYNLGARSKYHKKISAKHGCVVNIIKDGMSEDEANKLEIQLIAYYKSNGLCRANFSLGGEGCLGLKPSMETRNKMKNARIGKQNGMTGKHHSESSKNKTSRSCRLGSHKKKIKCLNNGIVYDSLATATRDLNLSGTSNLAKVLKGQRNHVNGMRFEYV